MMDSNKTTALLCDKCSKRYVNIHLGKGNLCSECFSTLFEMKSEMNLKSNPKSNPKRFQKRSRKQKPKRSEDDLENDLKTISKQIPKKNPIKIARKIDEKKLGKLTKKIVKKSSKNAEKNAEYSLKDFGKISTKNLPKNTTEINIEKAVKSLAEWHNNLVDTMEKTLAKIVKEYTDNMAILLFGDPGQIHTNIPEYSQQISVENQPKDPARGLDISAEEPLKSWIGIDPNYGKNSFTVTELDPVGNIEKTITYISTPSKPEGLFKEIEESPIVDEKLAWQLDLEKRARFAIEEAVKRTLSNSTFLTEILKPVVKELVESETKELEKIINNHAYIIGSIANKDMIESIKNIEGLSK